MYCLDTYALVEIHAKSDGYKFLTEEDFVITEITLAEFYWTLLKQCNEQTAEYWFNKLRPASIQVSISILRKAMLFRKENKEKKMSFFDCQGYVFAIENGHKFVTGDKEFKGMKGVLFVK